MKITLRNLRFGIELEGGGITRACAAQAVCKIVGGRVTDDNQVIANDGRVWKVVYDASLATWSPEYRCEVVSPILVYDDIPLLQEVIRSLRVAGLRVSPCCGIHIHVDATLFDGRQLATLAKLVYHQEPLIYPALGISEVRAARYTKPTDPAFIKRLLQRRPHTKDALNTLWYGQQETSPCHYHASRYRGVNFHAIWDKGTVEYRFFEATTHAGKVKAYIQFVLAVSAKAFNANAATCRQRTYNPASAKYDFRVFLIGALKMNGDEFKTARKHLLELMPGDAAFKNPNQRPGKKSDQKNKVTTESGAETLQPQC